MTQPAAKNPQKKPPSPIAYSLIAGVGLFVAVFFAFVRAYSEPSPDGGRFLEYVTLLVAGLGAATLCFGTLRAAFAYVKGTHGPVHWEVGGPVATLGLTVAGFYLFVPPPVPFVISVRVVDANGDPIEGATVKVHAGESPASKATDGEGYARYPGLETARLRRAEIDVQAAAFTPCRESVERLGHEYVVQLDRATTVRLEPGVSFSVRFGAAKGKLVLSEPGGECGYSSRCKQSASTAACEMAPLPPGERLRCDAVASIVPGDSVTWAVTQRGQQISMGAVASTRDGDDLEEYEAALRLDFDTTPPSCLKNGLTKK
jgi:hypothetical protein